MGAALDHRCCALAGVWSLWPRCVPRRRRPCSSSTSRRACVEPLPIAISEFYGATAGRPAARSRDRRRGQRRPRALGPVPADRPARVHPVARAAARPAALRRLAPDQCRGAGQRHRRRRRGRAAMLEVEFRLWDVFAGVQMRGLRFATTTDNWRRVAHQIADAVYQRITGEAPYFDTRIVYVAETGPRTDRVKRLAIMDQDGANHRFLTDGADLVLTPRFHPDADRGSPTWSIGAGCRRSTSATSPAARGAEARRLRRHDLRAALLARRPADRHVDSPRAAIPTSTLLDLGTGQQRRLTNHPVDRHLAVLLAGRPAARVQLRSRRHAAALRDERRRQQRAADQLRHRRYGSPAWSPRGDLIAFTKIEGGLFHIGVMRPDGSDERLLTRSTLDEGPDLVAERPGDPVHAARTTAPTASVCSAST